MHDAALVVSIFVVVMLLYSRWKIGRLRNQVTQLRGRMVQLEARRRGSSARSAREAPPLWRD